MDALQQLQIHTNFGVADWAIVVVFLVASTIAGMWAMRYIRDMEDYVVAGRSVRTYLGVASMIAAELGLVTVMYSAQMGFTSAFAAFSVAVLAAVAGLIVGQTGFIVVPLRRLGIMTIPEFYERRFSRGLRIFGGLILAASGILNMGMFLKADAMFVTSVVGMNDDSTLKWAMTVILLLVLLYTTVGGMISVIFTDYLQFAVMAIGMVVTSVILMMHFGWNGILVNVQQIAGEKGFNPLTADGIGPTYLVWMLFLGFISASVWQTSVMRATSAQTEKVVRNTYSWGAIGFLVRFIVPYFWGICALVFVFTNPQLREILLGLKAAVAADPENAKAAGDLGTFQLRAMPIALSTIMPVGLIGLLTAGMLAAAMSTYNTYLHTWSAVLTQDFVAPLMGNRLSSRVRINIARGIMCVIAFFLLVWGLWYPLAERLWDYMALTGAVYFTGAFAVLVCGIYWKPASRAGAYAAFASGFLMLLELGPIKSALTGAGVPVPRIEILGLVVGALALLLMVVVSLLVPDKPAPAAPAGEEVA
jgi:SSS family solute:Na+ symporter